MGSPEGASNKGGVGKISIFYRAMHFSAKRGIAITRPRNRSSRPLTIDPRQISINSIDRLDFWPFSRLGSTQRHGDRLDRLDRLYVILCICLGF